MSKILEDFHYPSTESLWGVYNLNRENGVYLLRGDVNWLYNNYPECFTGVIAPMPLTAGIPRCVFNAAKAELIRRGELEDVG